MEARYQVSAKSLDSPLSALYLGGRAMRVAIRRVMEPLPAYDKLGLF